MIIGTKHVDTPKISTTYNITNVFKNADGSIDSYQVEIAQTNGETYKVFLNSKEMAAVSDNVVAAYEYIRKSAAGYYLFDVLMGGCDLEYAEKYFAGLTIAFATILGYSAMAGAIGGGGLGALAINYGYYRYKTDVMVITLIILILMVQIFQWAGMKLARALDRRNR